MRETETQAWLFAMQDKGYRDFQASLLPTVDKARIIGVRVPLLRRYAKTMTAEQITELLTELPHRYFEEEMLHVLVLNRLTDVEETVRELDRLLPYVDNWAVCDTISPVSFTKHPEQILSHLLRWMASAHPFAVRYGILGLMKYFLQERFDPSLLERVSAVRSEEYYVRMMIAWYFATALAKQYDAALPYIEGRRLDYWTHNKAIQKCVESNRIPDERKAYLKTLKVRPARQVIAPARR